MCIYGLSQANKLFRYSGFQCDVHKQFDVTTDSARIFDLERRIEIASILIIRLYTLMNPAHSIEYGNNKSTFTK